MLATGRVYYLVVAAFQLRTPEGSPSKLCLGGALSARNRDFEREGAIGGWRISPASRTRAVKRRPGAPGLGLFETWEFHRRIMLGILSEW